MLAVTLVTLCSVSGARRAGAQSPPQDEHPLIASAAALDLRLGGHSMTGSKAERRLSPAVRAALNDWAEVIGRLELDVVVAEQADCLLLGLCDHKQMEQAAEWIDEAWELVQPLRREDDVWDDAVVGLMFDRQGARSEAWAGVLDVLVERGDLTGDGARYLKQGPGSLTMRDVPAFLQPTWDVAGDAAAGDDEFRLGNELVNKLVQCLMSERFGALPDSIRWGLGYVAEQRLFHSIYQFDGSGFVASGAHFDWPRRASAALKKLGRDRQFSPAEMIWDATGGRAETPQMVAWAALDQMLARDPQDLVEMLTALVDLHEQSAPFRGGMAYAGESRAARQVLARHIDAIGTKALIKHLKRVK